METTEKKTLVLEKGQRVDLTKDTGLQILCAGLGWDVKAGNEADLDAFAVCTRGGKVVGSVEDNVLYFGSPKHENGTLHIMKDLLTHSGDNLTGVGEGDDETITVNLAGLPPEIDGVLIAVNIFKAKERSQNFGIVNNAFARLYNQQTKEEMFKVDLTEDYSTNTGVLIARLYRKEGEWKLETVKEGYNGDINEFIAKYAA